jgi:glycosyltransferase involved in cell wall biosynthesis
VSRPHLFVLNERDMENPRAGGAEVHFVEIFGRLAARGFPVTLICAGFPGGAARTTTRGIEVVRVGNRYTFYARGPAAYRRLERSVQGPALLMEDLNKLPFYAPLYARLPILAIVHHLFGTTAFRQANLPVATVTYLSELAIPTIYRRVPMVAVSPSTREDLIARGVAAEHITMIPNGLDHELYSPAAVPPGRCVLSLGRVESYKRIDIAVSAMAEVVATVPDAHMIIVGRGSAVPGLERQVARLGLERAVEFRGFVSEREKVELYRGARVFVNPSEKEGWGLTILEANACGVPAVASDVPGLRDSVRHEETGLLVPHGDVEALAAALRGVLTDDATWTRLRAGAMRWAANFTWDAVTDQIQAVIERVAAGAAPARGGA